jgi:hypothetical protein
MGCLFKPQTSPISLIHAQRSLEPLKPTWCEHLRPRRILRIKIHLVERGTLDGSISDIGTKGMTIRYSKRIAMKILWIPPMARLQPTLPSLERVSLAVVVATFQQTRRIGSLILKSRIVGQTVHTLTITIATGTGGFPLEHLP